jgi:hypothetical protein
MQRAGPDRYQELRQLSVDADAQVPFPTLPSAISVANLLADGLGQALSSEGISYTTLERTLQNRGPGGRTANQTDRWVRVESLPKPAWSAILDQGMELVRSSVKERSSFSGRIGGEIGSLSELAQAYADFFRSGIIGYDKKRNAAENGIISDKKRNAAENGIIRRVLIAQVQTWTSGETPGNGGGGRPPGSGAQEITFVARSQEAAEEIFQGILPDTTLLSSEGLSFKVLVEGNALQVVTRLRESGLATSVNGSKVEGISGSTNTAGISAAPVAAAGVASIIGYLASQ